jgi:murein L,D-transpeptidase YcbB/YkuD
MEIAKMGMDLHAVRVVRGEVPAANEAARNATLRSWMEAYESRLQKYQELAARHTELLAEVQTQHQVADQGLRLMPHERKANVLAVVQALGPNASVKAIISELARRGQGQRKQTTRAILRELKDEGRYQGYA